MKIFDRDGKYNFVDDNNVFVGYSSQHDCCESFGYFFSDTIPSSRPESDEGVDICDGWQFDTKFYQEINPSDGYGEGTLAIFRLVKDNEEMFLCLYNYHNGYYSHGFSMLEDGKVIKEGNI